MQTNPLCRKTLSLGPPTCLPGWAMGGKREGGGVVASQATWRDTFPTTRRPKGKVVCLDMP